MASKNMTHNKNSSPVILRGKIEDVRGYFGEVELQLDSIELGKFRGIIEVRILSDEHAITFKGDVTGERGENKIKMSHRIDSEKPVEFDYEAWLIQLEKGVGITGSYKASSESGNTFLKAGVLNMVEVQSLPSMQENISNGSQSSDEKVDVENPFGDHEVRK